MKGKISRKNFIRNFGWLTAGAWSLPALISGVPPGEDGIYRQESGTGLSWPRERTTRGSWVRKGAPQSGDVQLAGEVNASQIVLPRGAHTAVRQAALFLAADIELLSGHRPEITEQPTPGTGHIYLVYEGVSGRIPPFDTSGLKDKWESFRIATAGCDLWLVGSDFRGTAFAAYQLSERLGIDPLHWWTGYEPEKQSILVMKQTSYEAPSPVFKYRGFFHDDEDILPRPFEMSGYPLRTGDVSLEWYQRFFETALRLGMNMVAPYTRVHRRQEVQRCASDWGLFYTSHHYDILLSNPFGIERYNLAEKRGIDPKWDWFTNRTGMEGYWKGGVEENRDLYAIWPVGLRGTDDHAYRFPESMSEDTQAGVFSDVINWQTKTVKRMLPEDHEPLFHFTLYTEMLEKYRSERDKFNLPKDVIIVWPDDNNGVMRALPDGTGKWKHGVYYHLAYFGGEKSKQATHIVSPYTVAAELGGIIKAKATEFLLVNVSEIRTHVMEARMIADISWKGMTTSTPAAEAQEYIQWWVKEYFGEPCLTEAVSVYRQYYQLLDTPDKVWYGSGEVESFLQELVKKFTGASFDLPVAGRISGLRERDEAYRAAMESVSEATGSMGRAASRFFREHAVLGLLFDYCPVRSALLLAKALAEPDEKTAWKHVLDAMAPLEQLEIAITRAEHPPFEKWYRETWIRKRFSRYNVHRSFELLRAFIAAEGRRLPTQPGRTGHAIAQAKTWTRFLEDSEKIARPMSKDWL